jgi:alpha-amylase
MQKKVHHRFVSVLSLVIFTLLVAFPLIGCATTDFTTISTNQTSGTTNTSTTNQSTTSTSSSTTINQTDVFYSVAFHLNGGVGQQPGVQVVKQGNVAVLPQENPSKDGYLFVGWFLDSEGTERFNFQSPVSSTVILFAGWEAEDPDYESTLSQWSEPGYLYIHYRRFVNSTEDYANWNLWIWPWLGDGIEVEWTKFDQSGAIAAINLNQIYTNGGPLKNKTVDFTSVEKIGFLVVFKPSKLGTGMWQSDGGADTFIDNIYSNVREDGSIHVFLFQNAVHDFKFGYDKETEQLVDPYEGLAPGAAVSIQNVNSSLNYYPKAPTAMDFYQNVGVGYSIQVSSFADSNGDGFGDIKGITNNLDYLAYDLNVKVLWLTPIHVSDSYHGYDIIDYYNIDPKFGTIEDFRELLQEAHKRGVRVLMDLVVNHSSANNSWFKKSTQLDPLYRNFYHWGYGPEYATKPHWYQYSDTGYYYFGKFSSSMPELNFDYQGTRDAVVDIALYWMSFGLDGFRVDAVKHFYNEGEYNPITRGSEDIIHNEPNWSRNATKNINLFLELNARIKSVFPDAFIVGENFDGNPANIGPYYSGMDSQFNFNLYFELVQSGLYRENNANTLARVYGFNHNAASLYRGDVFIDSTMTSNHDITRLLNHVAGQKVVNASNQLDAIRKAKVISAANLTLPGISWIFYGDELGMSGIKTNNIFYDEFGNKIGENDWHADRWFRQPFKFSIEKTEQTTGFQFETYTVQWDAYNTLLPGVQQQRFDSNSMLRHYMALTHLKANDPVLIQGSYEALATTNTNLFAFKRVHDGVTYYIYHNFSAASISNYSLRGNTIVWNSQGSSISTIAPYGSIIIR